MEKDTLPKEREETSIAPEGLRPTLADLAAKDHYSDSETE